MRGVAIIPQVILLLLAILLPANAFAYAPAVAQNRTWEIFPDPDENPRIIGSQLPEAHWVDDCCGCETALDVADGPNLYAYVHQNPWTKFDPLGLQIGYQGYWSEMGEVWKGYGNAAAGTVTGIIEVASHPIRTGQGIVNAVSHPVQTATAMRDAVVGAAQAIHNGDNEVAGEIIGDALIGAATGGALKVASKTATVAKIANKIDDVTGDLVETAKNVYKKSLHADETGAVGDLSQLPRNAARKTGAKPLDHGYEAEDLEGLTGQSRRPETLSCMPLHAC